MTILVIDDDSGMRTLVTLMLQRRGYHVLTASNGLEGLEVVRQQPIKVILTDLMMPKMDGFELIHAVRGTDELHKIPIIAFSAVSSPGELRQAIKAGANCTLSKPVTADILEANITGVLDSTIA